jgi:hypothetical protein
MSTERPVSRREFYAAITGIFALLLAVLSATGSDAQWQRDGLSLLCAVGLVIFAFLTARAKRHGGRES